MAMTSEQQSIISGYCLLAGHDAGLKTEQIKDLLNALDNCYQLSDTNHALDAYDGFRAQYIATNDMISTGKKGFEFLIGYIIQNWRCYKGSDGDPVAQTHGVIDDDYIYVVKSVAFSALENEGFEPKSIVTWMKQNGKTRCNNGNFWQKKINGMKVDCVCISKLKLDGDAKTEKLPF